MALRHIARASIARQSPAQRSFAAAASSDTITVQLDTPFVGHKLEQYGGPPEQSVETSKEEMVKMFETMYTMRRMEIASDVAYKSKFIRGFCHLYDGQEAICVGMEAALNHQDSIVTSYRDHCTHLGRGGTILEVMAELMGRVEGASKGIGGSMHMYRKEANFYGGNGIVGAQAPLGAGMAFKHKYSGEPNVACALYGDGAANQGQLFEALNIAALWDLPLIYICENNHYGMGTAEWRAAKNPHFYTRGDYVPGLKINGMDSLSVKKGMQYAKAHALANGPIVLEMDTYRYHGHSMSDPGSTYRTRDEITTVRQERDPVERMRKRIVEMELISTAEIKEMEKAARKLVDDAVAAAKESAYPPAEALFANMYSNSKELGVTVRGAEKNAVTSY